jgi:hypothetical protein
MATDKNTLKNWFRTGLKPNQAQFWAWIDSFWHKDEKIPISAIDDIEDILDAKADAEAFSNHINGNNPHPTLFNAKEDKSQKGTAGGYVPLNEFTKIASQYLNIVNDLVTGGTTDLASAETVKTLKTQIDAINLLLTSDNVNLDNVQELVDVIENVQASFNDLFINDLTTGGVTKGLTAEMGKVLKLAIDAINLALAQKQELLVSGTNIKTINNQPILGNGNISIESSPLKTFNESSQGAGYRLSNSDPNHFGNIGQGAVDFSFSSTFNPNGGARGQRSFCIGDFNNAIERLSFASGEYNTASGPSSYVGGAYSFSTGNQSFAYGFLVKSRASQEFSVGINGTDYVPNGFNDRVFNVGNGSYSASQSSDAFTVLRNGNTGIGTSLPTARLDIVGNARVRNLVDAENIVAYDRQVVSDIDGNFGFAPKVAPLKKVENTTIPTFNITTNENNFIVSILQIPSGFILSNELYEYIGLVGIINGAQPSVDINVYSNSTNTLDGNEILLGTNTIFAGYGNDITTGGVELKTLGNIVFNNTYDKILNEYIIIAVSTAGFSEPVEINVPYHGIRKLN